MSHQATAWAVNASQGRGLSWPAKGVLWHLADRHNPDHGCFPSQKRLAEDCEVSQSQLNVHLAALERVGLIRRVRQLDPKTRRQLPTRYTFAFEPGFEPVPDKEDAATDHQPDLPLSPEPTPEIGVGIEAENEAEPTPISELSRLRLAGVDIAEPVRLEPVSCVSDDGEAELDRAFTEFWNLHPRPKDRNACLQLFRQAVQAGEDARGIVDGARRYAREQAGNRPMYVCQSDNWLKGNRWRDGAAPGDLPAAEVESVADFWTASIRDGRYVPASAISPALARDMLQRGLVRQDDLDRVGVRP